MNEVREPDGVAVRFFVFTNLNPHLTPNPPKAATTTYQNLVLGHSQPSRLPLPTLAACSRADENDADPTTHLCDSRPDAREYRWGHARNCSTPNRPYAGNRVVNNPKWRRKLKYAPSESSGQRQKRLANNDFFLLPCSK